MSARRKAVESLTKWSERKAFLESEELRLKDEIRDRKKQLATLDPQISEAGSHVGLWTMRLRALPRTVAASRDRAQRSERDPLNT